MPTTKKTTTKKVEKKEVKPVMKKEVKKENKNKRTIVGAVVSDKMQKTVVVAIERKVAHPVYGKLIRVTKKIKADTNGMDIKVGDVVTIEETKPISKDKNFIVIKKEGGK